jgi:hypothetical protein
MDENRPQRTPEPEVRQQNQSSRWAIGGLAAVIGGALAWWALTGPAAGPEPRTAQPGVETTARPQEMRDEPVITRRDATADDQPYTQQPGEDQTMVEQPREDRVGTRTPTDRQPGAVARNGMSDRVGERITLRNVPVERDASGDGFVVGPMDNPPLPSKVAMTFRT